MKYAQLNKQQCETELKKQLLLAQNQISAFISQNEAQQQQLDDLRLVLRLQSSQLQCQDVYEISLPQCTAQSLQSRALSPHSGEQTEHNHITIHNQNLTDPVPHAKKARRNSNGLTNLKFTKYANEVLDNNGNPEEICKAIEKDNYNFFFLMQNQSFGKYSKNEFENYYKKIYAQALHKDKLTKDDRIVIFNESLKIRLESVKTEQKINSLKIAQQIQKQYFADKDIFIYNIVQIVEKTKQGK
ncbi:Hypothetical_protein [Hexamita inflata]|uniref:Hypothetical_protein n=1 Tax=Hexamita inflata TaxID=28002 RepID=A0AA86RC71_9EUKA|nr:Hypothetical protein HINF_LOCUS62465 [Hexamita inflata]